MLIDASVGRSFAVTGWSRHLITVSGGTIYVADGVHGEHADDPSELRNIRSALQRQADQADSGSGLASRALAAVHGLDEILTLPPAELAVLSLGDDELVWRALTRTQAYRTVNLLWQLVDDDIVDEVEAQEIHRQLQADDLHNLGGPPWRMGRRNYEKSSPASS